MGSVPERAFILFDDPGMTRGGKWLAVALMLTIAVSITAFVVETMPEVRSVPVTCDPRAPTVKDCEPVSGPVFVLIETICIVIFTIDYVVRVGAAFFVRPELAGVTLATTASVSAQVAPVTNPTNVEQLVKQGSSFMERIVNTQRSIKLKKRGLSTLADAEEQASSARDARGRRQKRGMMTGARVALRYALQPMNVIDFLAIAPFFIELALGGGGSQLQVVRVLRLARVLRLFKLGKHNKGVAMIGTVLSMSAPALQLLVFFSAIVIVVFASLLYFSEGDEFSVDPADFNNNTASFPSGAFVRPTLTGHGREPTAVRSIPWAFWWAATTLSTVGFGDIAPTSTAGKVVGVLLFYVGVILIALPISVLGTNFDLVYNEMYGGGDGSEGGEGEQGAGGPEGALGDGRWREFLEKRGALPDPIVTPRHKAVGHGSLTPREEQQWERMQAEKKRAARRASLSVSDFLATPWWPRARGLRRQLFLLFEDPSASRLGKIVSVAVLIAIVASCLTFCLETMPSFREAPAECVAAAPSVSDCRPRARPVFAQMETVFILIFSVEYLCRVITVHAVPPNLAGLAPSPLAPGRSLPRNGSGAGAAGTGGWHGGGCGPGALRQTMRYITQPMNVVDLVAIVPWYVSLAAANGSGSQLAIFRVLRLVRIFRVFKMGKYSTGAFVVLKCIVQSLPALSILLFLSSITCVLFGACMYFAEGVNFSVDTRWRAAGYPLGAYVRPTADGYDWEVSPFRSIPSSFWWFFTTTTTVGYGDFYPTTTAGKLIGVLAFCCGIVLLTLPVTIIGGNFTLLYSMWITEPAKTCAAATEAGAGGKEQDLSAGAGGDADASLVAALQRQVQELRADNHALRAANAAQAGNAAGAAGAAAAALALDVPRSALAVLPSDGRLPALNLPRPGLQQGEEPASPTKLYYAQGSTETQTGDS
eukprot:g3058.t1